MDRKATVFRIVLTGGPCGGKSTALSAICGYLRGIGVSVFTVPEAATILLSGGGEFSGLNEFQLIQFQASIITAMIGLEDSFVRIAESKGAGHIAVVLCDRGTMDASAYMPQQQWELMIDQFGWATPQLRDARYDAVIHLVTAAAGAESFYTTENNSTRTETPEQARAIDARLRQAWVGHPHHFIIGNEKQFSEKVQHVVAAICHVIGVPAPEPTAKLRKFSLSAEPTLPAELTRAEFMVEHLYLKAPIGVQEQVGETIGTTVLRLQTRSQLNSRTYTLLSRRTGPTGNVANIERRLTPREFAVLRLEADPDRLVIRKQVTSFLFQGLSLSISRFLQPSAAAGLIYVEVHPTVNGSHTGVCSPVTSPGAASGEIRFPPWLPVKAEVTDVPAFDSYHLSFKASPK